MPEIKNSINWGFFIPMFIACFSLIPIGGILISEKNYTIGIISVISGISLLIAFYNLIVKEYFGK